MELGAHLPLMEFSGEGQSLERIRGAAETARAHNMPLLKL